MQRDFNTVQCLSGSGDVEIEWFYINWKNTQNSGVVCFFLFATDGARPPSVAVLFVQHDLIANVTVYRTYSDSTQISKLVALFLENGISPLMQQCLSEIFGSDRPRTADLEFVGDGNCSIVSGNDLNLSAYGFSLRSTSALREFYELRTPTIGAIPSETRQVVGLKKVCDVFCGVSEPGLLDFRYLSITRCKVMQGPLPTYGIGQFDHQWGKMSRSGPRDWMWFNCWLPDGRDVLFYQVGKQDPQVRVVDVDGTTRSLECTTKVQSTWVSPRTLVAYAQHLIVTTTEFEVSVRPSFVDMEVETSLCVGGLFEGPAKCVFTGVGRSGPLEHLGFLPPVSCEAFIEIAAPTHLHQRFFRDHFENMQETIGPQISLLLGDLDEKQYIDVLGLPPSNLVDARGVLSYNRDYAKVMQYGLGGGSTWRSAMMVIATRMLTSSRSAVNAAVLLCPLLEVYHTASLMIDDIQDRSEKRRGKPCAYKTFGENKTLLAALTSTTLWTDVIDKCGLPDTTSYALCSLQGKAMRQLYLGQLQDVSDSDDLGLRRRDIEQLCSDPPRTNEIEHRIMGMHALKTGSAVAFALSVAGVLAEKHSIIGNLQAAGLEFGTAYQLMNDLLDYSMQSNKAGEDVRERKITMPLLLALKRMDHDTRVAVMSRFKISSKAADPMSPDDVTFVIEKVIAFGGVEATRYMARNMVSRAWDLMINLDGETLPASLALLQMRVCVLAFLGEI